MTAYALFQNGKQISKAHSTRLAARVEAYEIGAVVTNHADFPGDVQSTVLADGYEIKEVQP